MSGDGDGDSPEMCIFTHTQKAFRHLDNLQQTRAIRIPRRWKRGARKQARLMWVGVASNQAHNHPTREEHTECNQADAPARARLAAACAAVHAVVCTMCDPMVGNRVAVPVRSVQMLLFVFAAVTPPTMVVSRHTQHQFVRHQRLHRLPTHRAFLPVRAPLAQARGVRFVLAFARAQVPRVWQQWLGACRARRHYHVEADDAPRR